MPATLIKCHVKGCERDCFQNELVDIPTSAKKYRICINCWNDLKLFIADKKWIGSLYKGMVMSQGEQERLRIERALSYARNSFNFTGIE